jgi:hypothetical protein
MKHISRSRVRMHTYIVQLSQKATQSNSMSQKEESKVLQRDFLEKH